MKIPFNIELFKKHGSKVEFLEYDNGDKPSNIHINEDAIRSSFYPITTVIDNIILTHSSDGSCSKIPNTFNLFINIPDEIVEFYQNIYPDTRFGVKYDSLEEANESCGSGRLAINKITINKTTGEVKSEILPG